MSIPPLKYCLGFPVLTVLFSVCFLMVFGLTNPLPPIQAVRWETDLNIAMARAEREQRPLFLHFVGNESPSAQQMANEIFVLPNIAAHLNANFVMVRVNAVENSALAQRFTVTAIPTDLIMRPNGHIIHRRVGVITADRFAQYLTFLQEMIQSEKSQAPVQTSTPSPATGTFPVVNPSVSPHPAPPSMAVPPKTTLSNALPPATPQPHQQETFAAVPGAIRDPFTQQSPAMQQPVAHQPPPLAQHPQGGVGMMGSPMSSGSNPLRTAEMATRPALEQSTAPVSPSPATTAIQAMLATPAPPKKTVEVPLALEGFCPVILCTEERWVTGNPAYCTMYQGYIFRFSSMEALATFARNPAHYTPVAMGEDIVLKVDRNRRVNGDRRFGAWFQGRVFLFSSQETFNAFEARPDYYAEIASKYEIARREQPAPVVY